LAETEANLTVLVTHRRGTVTLGRSYFLGILLALGSLPAARGAPPQNAQVEINYLLASIGASSCEFYRNGVWYDSNRAAEHLRSKYDFLAERDQIQTAEDFIDKAATSSSMSGEQYQIKCGDAAPVSTHQWMLEALAHLRESRANIAACAPAMCGVRKTSTSDLETNLNHPF
jgi:hypothetical protein